MQASITRGSVEKYLQLGLRLSEKYNVGDYLRSRFVLASEELATLFKPEGQQMDMSDYFGVGTKIPETPIEILEDEEKKGIKTSREMEKPLPLTINDEKEEEERKQKRSKVPVKIEQYQATLF